MPTPKRIASVLALWLCTSGCATLVNGTKDDVRVQSVPDGAAFTIFDYDGEVVASGNTPMFAEVSRRGWWMRAPRYTVMLAKEGYHPRVFKLSSRISPWYFGNPIAGGIIGFIIVDPLAGGMWDLRDPLPILLEPVVVLESAPVLESDPGK